MAYWEEDERDEYEFADDPIETCTLAEPGPCCTCGKPDCTNGCFRCGQPVCYNNENYFSDTDCGGWILDTWHPEHPEGNEFYCFNCLRED